MEARTLSAPTIKLKNNLINERNEVNPSTLLYVKDHFRNRYSNVFRKFQQGNVSTLEDVGILEDVTRERIRQIEAKTFRK